MNRKQKTINLMKRKFNHIKSLEKEFHIKELKCHDDDDVHNWDIYALYDGHIIERTKKGWYILNQLHCNTVFKDEFWEFVYEYSQKRRSGKWEQK